MFIDFLRGYTLVIYFHQAVFEEFKMLTLWGYVILQELDEKNFIYLLTNKFFVLTYGLENFKTFIQFAGVARHFFNIASRGTEKNIRKYPERRQLSRSLREIFFDWSERVQKFYVGKIEKERVIRWCKYPREKLTARGAE